MEVKTAFLQSFGKKLKSTVKLVKNAVRGNIGNRYFWE